MRVSRQEALKRGVAAHKSGRFQEAARYYMSIIKASPQHPDANHNMGVLTRDYGNIDQALIFFKNAIEASPAVEQFWISYLETLISSGRQKEAMIVLEQAQKMNINCEKFNNLKDTMAGKNKVDNGLDPKNKIPHEEITRLLKLYQKGEFQKVISDGLLLQKKYSEDYTICNLVGASAASTNQYKTAEASFRTAISINFRNAEGHNNLGNVLKDQGKLSEALPCYENAISLNPDYADAHYNMGNTYTFLNQFEDAADCYQKAISINANHVSAYFNLGNALASMTKFNDAIDVYNKVITQKPNHVSCHFRLGETFHKQGKINEAIRAYKTALGFKHDFIECYINIGILYQTQGKLEKATGSFRKAIEIKPDFAPAFCNLGNLFEKENKFDEAIESYTQAVSIEKKYIEAWLNCAVVLEKWNRLDQLASWLETASRIFKNLPDELKFMQCKLLWRTKKFNKLQSLIKQVQFDKLSEPLKIDFLNFKGKFLDRMKDFDGAFESFHQCNVMIMNSAAYKLLRPSEYLDKIKDDLQLLQNKQTIKLQNSKESSDFEPVFLIGFPRSGTTLLDTILRTHSKISVIEEKPSVLATKNHLSSMGYSNFFENPIPHNIVSNAQTFYVNELNKYVTSIGEDNVIIDKLPLNLIHAPFISAIYPRAKFILALRHPMDSILSCWMQNFRLNDAMANMLELEVIVDFYCVAMEMFKLTRASCNLNVHEVRYEDLVSDFQHHTNGILNYLNLTWESKIESYQLTALNRGKIDTPSYSQVIEPLYNHAKFRWSNYSQHFDRHYDRLRPWISEFNYVAEGTN